MLFWKLEQWIERQFVHFVHSSLAIRECTKWANGLSIYCSSLQNVFLCYFKNIDRFLMCLIVFVLADSFAQRSQLGLSCATIRSDIDLCPSSRNNDTVGCSHSQIIYFTTTSASYFSVNSTSNCFCVQNPHILFHSILVDKQLNELLEIKCNQLVVVALIGASDCAIFWAPTSLTVIWTLLVVALNVSLLLSFLLQYWSIFLCIFFVLKL